MDRLFDDDDDDDDDRLRMDIINDEIKGTE